MLQQLLQKIPPGLKFILVTYSAIILLILAGAFFVQKSQFGVISRYDYNVTTNTHGPNYPFSATEAFFAKIAIAPSIHYADGQWIGRWPPYAQMGYMVVIIFFLLCSLPAVVVIKYPEFRFFVLGVLVAMILGWISTVAWNGNWFGFDSDTSGLGPLIYSIIGSFVFVIESVLLISHIKKHSSSRVEKFSEQQPQIVDVSAAKYFRIILKWLLGVSVALVLPYLIYMMFLIYY